MFCTTDRYIYILKAYVFEYRYVKKDEYLYLVDIKTYNATCNNTHLSIHTRASMYPRVHLHTFGILGTYDSNPFESWKVCFTITLGSLK